MQVICKKGYMLTRGVYVVHSNRCTRSSKEISQLRLQHARSNRRLCAEEVVYGVFMVCYMEFSMTCFLCTGKNRKFCKYVAMEGPSLIAKFYSPCRS